jgi:Notch-like protein
MRLKKKIMKSLKTRHSHGYVEICVKILKLSALFVSSPLTYVCNKCLSSGIFPTRLKFSIAKPVFKNGDKFDISNFRPVYLLTSFSKVFEKVICARVYQHISQINVLVNEQYGFRSNSSEKKVSHKLINEILLSVNNK